MTQPLPPPSPPSSTPPAGFRLCPDPGARVLADGMLLAGGSPVRVLRLTAAGARQVAAWWGGAPVPDEPHARALARRLLDTGLAHPALGDGGAPSGADVAAAGPVTSGDAAGPGISRGSGHCPGFGPRDVTVVIPVFRRAAELARCLEGLSLPAAAAAGGRSQARPGRPEVIVVDDGSPAPDAAAIARAAAAGGARLVRRPVNGGPGAARNTGLAAAGTPLVAFLDSDCVPRQGWLGRLLPHFADPAAGAVAPRIVPHVPGSTWLARYEGASSTLDMGARPSVVRPGSRVPYVPGAALVVRKAAAGAGFDEDMPVGEDVDFAWRMAAAGWRIRYEPAAVMGHQHRVRLRAWFARRKDYGTSAAALEQRHPRTVRPLYVSGWTALAWLAALSGRPAAASAVTGTATALLARRLGRVTRAASGQPQPAVAWRLAVRLAGGGTLAAAPPLGSALSRTWWPVAVPAAVVTRRLRLPLAALMLAPPLLDWLDRRPPLGPARYVAARLLDDAAYSLGVWQGCLRRRTIRPLLPAIGSRREPPGPIRS
ncbi:MAG: mycofactocin biosynthesis glycosyltransferase MftF [Streptosporangiaceae bacterium]|nr:mycofactocin biosynthesis glycosyltransferase MftF [Streptosporangiaceae bacterium]